jgi:hypothetical protein
MFYVPIEAHKEPPPMSSNPEQIPKSSETEVPVPHSGKLDSNMRERPVVHDLPPLTEDNIDDITAADTVHANFGGDETRLSSAEKAEFDQWRQSRAEKAQTSEAIPTPETAPTDEAPTPEAIPVKKKNKLARWALAGLGAGVVFAASTAVYVNAITSGITNSADKDLPPAPETNNSGELTPGQPQATAAPAPESRTGLGQDTHKFFGEDGKSSQTFEQLSESINIPASENKDSIEAQTTYYKLMEKMANYFPSEEEVRNNLNIPTAELTVEDYIAACKLYHKAYDSLYESPSGKLHQFMNELAVRVAYAKLGTLNEGDAVPYNVTIDFAKTAPQFTIADNALENSIDDINTITGTYDLTFTGFGPNKTSGKDPVWLVDGNVQVARTAATK